MAEKTTRIQSGQRIKFLNDEDLRGPIIEGVKRRLPHLDIVRVQDVGLRTLDDRDVLEFAATDNRILLSSGRD